MAFVTTCWRCLVPHASPLLPSFVSMPRTRESLKSAKTRLAREQQTRTERRIQALLQPRLTGQDAEIFDDIEEENKLIGIGRRVRAKRDQASKTDISSYSFCCGVLVGVCLVVFLVFCLALACLALFLSCSCLVLSCLVLPCLASLVLSCYVLSCLILFYLARSP